MSGAQPRSLRFRREREADWLRLEALLAKAERGRLRALTEDELIALPRLYQAAIASLSTARATSLDASLVAYLEALATRAYVFVYGSRARLGERLAQFFRKTWPEAVRAIWRETAISAAIMLVATVAAFVLVLRDPDWYGSIIPAAMAQGRDPSAATSTLKAILYGEPGAHGAQGLSLFATFLFTHNAQIAILAFALGFAFCLPTALLVAQNGLMLGAMLALYASRGLGLPMAGWLFIHGTTELFAVILGGAAGFRIGWAVMFPGPLTRLDSAARAGRTAGAVMAGVTIMLVVAGVLEGIGRQLIVLDWARGVIGAGALALWLGYFYLPRREAGR